MSRATFAAVFAVVASSSFVAHGAPLPGVSALPTTVAWPTLWFDGSSPAELTGLAARVTHTRTQGYYASFKAVADGALASIATTTNDDLRAQVAKAAALLQVLGATPPSGSGYTTYRDVAVTAIVGLRSRQAIDTVTEVFSPPTDAIDILQDSPRLQSIAEAYDLLRGTGVSGTNDAALQAKIAQWATAVATDFNLSYPSLAHRDNWSIKGGSALVTTALALRQNTLASTWLATGMTYVQEGLTAVASTTGWYRESPWYLNYALNGLVSTAWHVRHATGIDWFPALRPLVTTALALRQPDGRAPPFEEGLPNTFPWDVLATAYPDLAPTMLWAWAQSPQNDENYENQALHTATRFLLADLTTSPAAAPDAPVTRFVAGDARAAALRTGWDAHALQVTTITATDHSTSETFTSRHNMRNPLDLMVSADGVTVVPTASGGPTVTTSTNRAAYLDVRAKNVPLVDGAAPFIDATTTVGFGDLLDSENDPAGDNHYVDLARTSVTHPSTYHGTVTRTVALVDEGYVVVADRFALDASRSLGLGWRGRGARTERVASTSHIGETWAGVAGAPSLAIDVVGTAGLTASAFASYYADSWAHEETIDATRIAATGASASFVSVLGTGAPRTVTAVSTSDVAACEVATGLVVDRIVAPRAPGLASADGVTTDGWLALARSDAGDLAAVALVGGTVLAVDGATVVQASQPTTLGLTASATGFVAELAADGAGGLTLTIEHLPAIDAAHIYSATFDGVPLSDTAWSQSGSSLTFDGLGPGRLVVTTAGLACPVGDACDDGDACTDDDQCQADGSCAGTPHVCATDALCAGSGTCQAGACGYVDGPIVGHGDDPDGLFCTVSERCVAGRVVTAARDCGAAESQCATGSSCDEATRACVDVGTTCDPSVVRATVVDDAGQPIGTITCHVLPGGVECDHDASGTLVIDPDLYCR